MLSTAIFATLFVALAMVIITFFIGYNCPSHWARIKDTSGKKLAIVVPIRIRVFQWLMFVGLGGLIGWTLMPLVDFLNAGIPANMPEEAAGVLLIFARVFAVLFQLKVLNPVAVWAAGVNGRPVSRRTLRKELKHEDATFVVVPHW